MRPWACPERATGLHASGLGNHVGPAGLPLARRGESCHISSLCSLGGPPSLFFFFRRRSSARSARGRERESPSFACVCARALTGSLSPTDSWAVRAAIRSCQHARTPGQGSAGAKGSRPACACGEGRCDAVILTGPCRVLRRVVCRVDLCRGSSSIRRGPGGGRKSRRRAPRACDDAPSVASHAHAHIYTCFAR